MKTIRQISLALGLGAGLLCEAALAQQVGTAATFAAAQDSDQLEEVVVTAERRTEDVQKTAAAVDVRSGADLNKEGRFTQQQILEDVPGVAVTVGPAGPGGDSPGESIVIRGVVPNAGTIVPTTAVYTDGIYSGIGSSFDIDRIEVLKGPQGTLYGRSATAGVVATYTHDPVLGKFDAQGTAEVGSYDLSHDTGVVNIPLGDQLAIRAAGNYYSREGFISSQGGYNKITDGRLKALYKPNDDVSLLVGWAVENNYTYSGGNTLSLTPPGPYNAAAIPSTVNTFYTVPGAVGPLAETQSHQIWAQLNWNLGFGTLTYLPAYRTFYANGTTVGLGPAGPTGARIPLGGNNIEPTDKFLTHEVRLASAPDSMLIWQVGGLYYDNSYITDGHSYVIAPGDPLIFDSDVAKNTKDVGVFGEATLPLANNTWRLTAGLRYDNTKVGGSEVYTVAGNPFGLAPVPNIITSLTLPPGAADSTFNNVTFKARVETDLSASNLLYAMISSGFLPGDVDITTGGSIFNPVAAAIRYNQEKLTAYEIGSKNRFLDNRLQLNGDVFYYTYTGYQANLLTSPLNPAFAIVTSPARMDGAELEALYQLTASDRVSATYAYLNAHFVNEPSCPGAVAPCFAQLVANTKIPNIPPETFTARYDHDWRLSGGSVLNFDLDTRFTSSYQFAYLLPVQAPYSAYPQVAAQWIGDLSIGWTAAGGKYSISGYMRNIADNAYKNGAQLSGLGTTFSATGTRYDPRTVGLIVHAGL